MLVEPALKRGDSLLNGKSSMSHFARASRTGVEKVAAAIVLSRRWRRGRRVDASAVASTPTAVGPGSGAREKCAPARSSPLLRYSPYSPQLSASAMRNAGLLAQVAQEASLLPPQKSSYLAACKTLALPEPAEVTSPS